MRVILHLYAPAGTWVPVHYNELLQAFVYRHLDEALAERLHDQGHVVGRRRLKLFTFSRLLGRGRLQDGGLLFAGPLRWVVASPMVEMLESFALHVVRAGHVAVGAARLELASVELQKAPPYRCPAVVRALSPITVYSTLLAPNGARKTYYYAPAEREFGELAVQNLQRKAVAWFGAPHPVVPGDAWVRPVRVRTHDLRVVLYKGTVVKAWTGLYRLHLPEPLFRLALDCGLGAKNAQGFGCVELCEPRRADAWPDAALEAPDAPDAPPTTSHTGGVP